MKLLFKSIFLASINDITFSDIKIILIVILSIVCLIIIIALIIFLVFKKKYREGELRYGCESDSVSAFIVVHYWSQFCEKLFFLSTWIIVMYVLCNNTAVSGAFFCFISVLFQKTAVVKNCYKSHKFHIWCIIALLSKQFWFIFWLSVD